MPELPEVETIKNELAPCVVGRRIVRVELPWEGIVREPTATELCARLTGRQITDISRRGKYLFFGLKDAETLVIHLKMSGALLLKPANAGGEKYIRAILYLDNGTAVFFRDPRKFGRMWLIADCGDITDGLGPEPLEPGFTAIVLAKRLERHTAPIKAALLDQGLIAGIGNMYADEALFEARLHPLQRANSLSPDGLSRLYRAIRFVLEAGIKNKGASVINYYRPDGNPGSAHLEFRVAHRGGKSCPLCGTPIERIVVRGRGSYFCPRCQRLPPGQSPEQRLTCGQR
jgi:formamidopyrimidine-DNA glycosylase